MAVLALVETAHHRRQRRQRTQARFTLKSWLKGHCSVAVARLLRACQLLEEHHSASLLPSQVRRRLQSTMMQQGGQGWWCEHCRRMVKKDANFCPACGAGWRAPKQRQGGGAYTAKGHEVPWADGWWEQQPRSPRRRPEKSPRRGGGKGPQKGKDNQGQKGKSKDRQPAWGQDQQPSAPSLDVLPAAPPGPSMALPKKGNDDSQPATASSEKSQFEALVKILAASSVTLPEAAQQLVADAQQTSVQTQARAHHKAVADHNKAKQALTKVQQTRAVYLRSWAEYTAQLTQLVEKQVKEQGRILEDLDAAEVQWTVAEHQAKKCLARLMNPDADEDKEEIDMNGPEEMVDVAVDMEAKLRSATEAKQYEASQVLSVLGKIRSAAAAAMGSGSQEREGSRTPRRTSASDVAKEDAPPGAGESQPGKAQGKATTPFHLRIKPAQESIQEARS